MEYTTVEIGIKHMLLILWFAGNIASFVSFIIVKIANDGDASSKIGRSLHVGPRTFIGAIFMLIFATPFYVFHLKGMYSCPRHQILHLYSYAVNQGEYRGCVRATSVEDGVAKVSLTYLAMEHKLAENNSFKLCDVKVWRGDECAVNRYNSDVIEVY